MRKRRDLGGAQDKRQEKAGDSREKAETERKKIQKKQTDTERTGDTKREEKIRTGMETD